MHVLCFPVLNTERTVCIFSFVVIQSVLLIFVNFNDETVGISVHLKADAHLADVYSWADVHSLNSVALYFIIIQINSSNIPTCFFIFKLVNA